MSDLEKEFEKTGVEPVTPTGGDGDPPKEPVKETKVAEEGDKGGKEGSIDRPSENFYRELLRKSEKNQEQMAERIENVFEKMTSTLGNLGQPSVAPTPAAEPQNTGNPLDKFSIDDLNTALAQGKVPDEQKAGYQAYISQRIAREIGAASAKDVIQKHDRESDILSKRRQALETAQDKFPDLGNKNSKFYKAVDKMIKGRGKAWFTNNPMAILDAAHAVAVASDIKPARRQIDSRPANRRDHSSPVGTADDKPLLSEEQQAAIEKKLGHALGKDADGKPRKFNRKDIADGHEYYNGTRNLRIK